MAKKKVNGNEPVTFDLLTKFYAQFLKPQFDKINNKLDGLDKKVDRNSKLIKENRTAIERNSTKISKLDDQLEGLKADYSDTVSKKEFNEFKSKALS